MIAMEQEQGMKGFTELTTWAFLQPGSAAKPNITALKEAVSELCRMATQKTAGQRNHKSGRKYNERDIDVAANLERVKFTIIAEATLLYLSGKLDELEEDEDGEEGEE